jgi:hypothetical protein
MSLFGNDSPQPLLGVPHVARVNPDSRRRERSPKKDDDSKGSHPHREEDTAELSGHQEPEEASDDASDVLPTPAVEPEPLIPPADHPHIDIRG